VTDSSNSVHVRLQDLTVRPHATASNSETVAILNAVNLELVKGERVLLLGPSGAGKSTLMLALSGVLQSLDLAEVTGLIEAPESGLLLQNSMDATVGQTVFRDAAFGAESAGVPALQISQLVDYALKSVSLSVDLERSPSTLSGGELQRLCLAGLMTLAPELLLLDEPTSMLDPKSAFEVRMAVGEYLRKSGATAVIAEHKFEVWLPLVTRVVILGTNGEIIDDGSTAEVISKNESNLLKWGLWIPGAPAPLTPGPKVNRSGGFEAIVGVSGSGKTSLLNQRLNEAVEKFGATQIGWVPQNPTLSFYGDTVLDSASVTATKLLGGVGRENALAWLERMGLAGKVQLHPTDLSGGEQRRLAIASALAHEPKMLFLDEPTVGQDRINWLFVVSAILEASSSGVEVVVATHDADLIEFADRIEQLQARSAKQDNLAKQAQLTNRTGVNTPKESRDTSAPSPLGLLTASALLLFGSFYIQTLGQAFIGVVAVAASFVAAWKLGYKPKLGGPLWPVLFGIVSLGVSNWWLSATPNPERALLAALRMTFFVIPGVLLAREIRVPVLGDQLGQLLRLPARPVIAGMVALSRVAEMRKTWDQLALLRKLRALDQTAKPVKLVRGRITRMRDSWNQRVTSRFRRVTTLTLQLLLQSIRSATVTAIAMESRGFSNIDEAELADQVPANHEPSNSASAGKVAIRGLFVKYRKRSWAVPAKLTTGDTLLVAAAACCAALVILF
jgi:energy-coupling factor transporter ATP-binding protein EcfA2